MKHVFIVNPAAGNGSALDLEPLIEREAARLGADAVIKRTTRPGFAGRLARSYCETGEPVRFYACGGDGTLNETLAGCAGYENSTLTHIPCGTGNDFVKTYGGAERFRNVAALMTSDEIRRVDLIEDADGNLAVNICSVGVDADVTHRVHDFDWAGKGKMPYNLSLVKTVISGIHRRYNVWLDGRDVSGDYSILTVCNGTTYGGGFKACPDAVPDDGEFEILMARAMSRLTLAKIVGTFQSGGYKQLPEYIRHARGRYLKISASRPFITNFDGETRLQDKVEFKMSNKKVNFVLPREVT